MNSTIKTLHDASTLGITFDVADNTIVAPRQPMRVKVTYAAEAAGTPVTTSSVFTTDSTHHLATVDSMRQPVYDNYFRDTTNNIMSAYLNIIIDPDVGDSTKVPSVTVTFGTASGTLTLAGKELAEFSERGFAPVVYGNFIKDLNPAAQNTLPDVDGNGYVKVRVNAIDKDGNGIAHFQVPLWADTNFVTVRMFPTDDFTLEGEIIPAPGGIVFPINTDDNGSRELYLFVGPRHPSNVNSSTLDLSVNINGLSYQNANNQVLIIAGNITKPKSDAPIIQDMDGDTLDPGLSDDPDFTVTVPVYKGHKDNDVIYILAKDGNGIDTYLGHKKVRSGYVWGVTPLLDVPFNAFPAVGDYYVYYYAADTSGNATQSEDLYVKLVSQVPNLPNDGTKKFPNPVSVHTVFGLEVTSPPGNVNEYAIVGGLDIRVPVDLNNASYVHKGQSVVVTMRTDGWAADGSKKARTLLYPAQAAVSDTDISQGYISVAIGAVDLAGYDSNSHGRPGSITFEYSVNADTSEAWYGRIDTTAPGESK